jgi:ATP-dependent Clp endopeptidase proteolytic subunit ClpP
MPKKKTREPYIIFIADRIHPEVLETLQGGLLEAKQNNQDVTVRLCSPGGEAMTAFAIHDLLRFTFPNRVTTEVFGDCASAAVIILMAGSVRRASVNSRLMVHNGLTHIDGTLSLSAEQFGGAGKELSILNNRYNSLIATRSVLELDEVARWAKKETYFSAAAALSVGLVDEVIGA